METNISLLFSDLSIPSQNSKNYLIEVLYENKKEIITYPQSNPTIITPHLKTDKLLLLFHVKPKQSKKQKTIYRGEIIVFKKLLQEKPIEKYIFLFAKEKETDRIKPNIESGKIFVKIKSVYISEENISNKSNRKVRAKEREETLEIIDTSIKTDLKNDNNAFADDILDIKAEPINKNELKSYNIDEIISIDTINKLKELIDKEEIKNCFFSNTNTNTDIDSLKNFNKNLFKNYKDINEYYAKILTDISKNNQEMKEKIQKYNKDNEKLEEELNKLRFESKQNNEQIDQIIKDNNEKIDQISKNIEEINHKERNVLDVLQNNVKNDEKEVKNYGDDNDLKNICNLIKNLNALGFSIDEGDITDSEKQNLNDLLNNENNFKNSNNNSNQKTEENNDEDIKENYELGNIIVTLIERDVNDLYMRKLIEQIKIDQIDAITYCFIGEKKNKEVVFKIENNNLICSTGETFTVWLIKNFSL